MEVLVNDCLFDVMIMMVYWNNSDNNDNDNNDTDNTDGKIIRIILMEKEIEV